MVIIIQNCRDNYNRTAKSYDSASSKKIKTDEIYLLNIKTQGINVTNFEEVKLTLNHIDLEF